MALTSDRFTFFSRDGAKVPINCHHCFYYIPMDDSAGECHYHPPVGRNFEYEHLEDIPDKPTEWLFPTLDGANYCSKWKWSGEQKVN